MLPFEKPQKNVRRQTENPLTVHRLEIVFVL
jgi:hypothetical protein